MRSIALNVPIETRSEIQMSGESRVNKPFWLVGWLVGWFLLGRLTTIPNRSCQRNTVIVHDAGDFCLWILDVTSSYHAFISGAVCLITYCFKVLKNVQGELADKRMIHHPFAPKKAYTRTVDTLVGGFNPFEKYESKWESSQIEVNIFETTT